MVNLHHKRISVNAQLHRVWGLLVFELGLVWWAHTYNESPLWPGFKPRFKPLQALCSITEVSQGGSTRWRSLGFRTLGNAPINQVLHFFAASQVRYFGSEQDVNRMKAILLGKWVSQVNRLHLLCTMIANVVIYIVLPERAQRFC